MAETEGKQCETPGCDNDAKLQCPTCIKLGIAGSFFCSQECFKGYWTQHKAVHKSAKTNGSAGEGGAPSSTASKTAAAYNPWPAYTFTGKLRPFPQSDKRQVKSTIARPDYADSREGFPTSERAARGSSVIKSLNDEELEDMKVACRLGREVNVQVDKFMTNLWSSCQTQSDSFFSMSQFFLNAFFSFLYNLSFFSCATLCLFFNVFLDATMSVRPFHTHSYKCRNRLVYA